MAGFHHGIMKHRYHLLFFQQYQMDWKAVALDRQLWKSYEPEWLHHTLGAIGLKAIL